MTSNQLQPWANECFLNAFKKHVFPQVFAGKLSEVSFSLIVRFFIFRSSRVCIGVLHAFVNCLTLFTTSYRMHVKFCMHGNLTDARNFYGNFPFNMQNLNAADMFQILQNFLCSR